MKPLQVTGLFSLSALLIIGLLGCMDLDVANPNEPDAEASLASIEDVDALLGGAYRIYWDMLHYNGWAYPSNALDVATWVSSASWGNFGMRDLGSLPRAALLNTEDYVYRQDIIENPWYGSYGALSSANDALTAVKLGVYDPDPARKARAQAFAKFTQGVVHGWLALYYDQAFIFDENVDINAVAAGTEELELSPASEVYQAAMGFLQAAEDIASSGSQWALPESWLRGNGNVNNANLIQLINTVRARITASMPRTPADRAALNWNQIISWVDAGITEDFRIESEFPGWYDAYRIIGQQDGWVGASYYNVGLADESGAFQTWLATDPNLRESFDVVTADRRVVGPEGGQQRGKYFQNQGNHWHPQARGQYFWTRYIFKRFCPDPETGELYCGWGMGGSGIHMPLAEMDFLKAEGLWRNNAAGNAAAIADIINKYRVPNGELPPVDPATATAADLLYYIQYEKRFETQGTHPGISFFDARGWPVIRSRKDATFGTSDLPLNTPVQFPVPVKELNIWDIGGYTFGGGGAGSAAKASPVAPARE